jgi:hypothetical protein
MPSSQSARVLKSVQFADESFAGGRRGTQHSLRRRRL